MKIKFLGHAAFLITSDLGTRIITDPYTTNDQVKYGVIKEAADVVTVSHGHGDHSNAAIIPGNPTIVKGTASVEIKGVKIKGIACFHDEAKGQQRGNNVIFCFEADGMRLCHLGDLGHQLAQPQIAEIGKVDILFVPVGGFFTIDANAATRVCDAMAPKVIVPMHFKTPRLEYPIAPVEDFLKGKKNVTRLDTSETEFKRDKLPTSTQIVVLKPAL